MKKDLKKIIIKSERTGLGNDELYAKDYFYIFGMEDLNNISSTIKQVSATDYAIANQAIASPQYKCLSGKPATLYWTPNYYIKKEYGIISKSIRVVDTKGVIKNGEANITRPATVPAFNINAKDIKTLNGVVSQKGVYHTVTFPNLQYPQSKVSDRLASELEYFYNTRKPSRSGWYIGSITKNKEWKAVEENNEYIYNGKRYVRVVGESEVVKRDDLNYFADGTQCKNGEVYWFEVEPITWIIANWENASINPVAGPNETDELVLRAEEALLGGIPFSTNKTDENKGLWQNSYIRALLNGYNLKDEIKNGNGNKDYKISTNYDFSGKDSGSFIDSLYKEDVKFEVAEVEEQKNPHGVTISSRQKSLDEQIEFYVNNGLSFMLHGRSGIGKTRRVQELDPDFVMLKLRKGILPEEIVGKSYEDNGKAVWVQPYWYRDIWKVCKNDPDNYHVLLLDELTNVSDVEQSLVYDIVFEHFVNGKDQALPKNCIVIATGNSPKESSVAYNMPEPLFRRFAAHIYIEPNIQSFLKWGGDIKEGYTDRTKIHPAVSAFIASRGLQALFTDYDPDEPPLFAVDPRSWEQVSDIIYACNGEVDYNLILNKVGKELANDFINFIRVPQITINDIMRGKIERTMLPKTSNEKYSLTLSLRWATEDQVEKVRDFVKKYLGGENLAIFDSIWIGNDDERALIVGELDEGRGL